MVSAVWTHPAAYRAVFPVERQTAAVLCAMCVAAIPLNHFQIGRDYWVVPLFLGTTSVLVADLLMILLGLFLTPLVALYRLFRCVLFGRGEGALLNWEWFVRLTTMMAVLTIAVAFLVAIMAEFQLVHFLFGALLFTLAVQKITGACRRPLTRFVVITGVVIAAIRTWTVLPDSVVPFLSEAVFFLACAGFAGIMRFGRERQWSGFSIRHFLLTVFLPVAVPALLLHNNKKSDEFALSHMILDVTGGAFNQTENPVLYDIKVEESSHRVYYSDSDAGKVGYVDWPTAQVNVSEYIEKSVQQIVLDVRKPQDFTSKPSWLYLSSPFGLIVLDHDRLAVVHKVTDVRALIDLAASPSPRFLAAIAEFSPNLFWFNVEDWTWLKIHIPTWTPYQVLCSDRLSRCYISGWLFSATMSEVTISPQGKPADVRGLFVGPFSLGMTWLPGHRQLLLVHPLSGTLDVIDTSSLRRERRVRVPPMVRAIAYWPEADIVFAAQQFAGRVHLIRMSSGEEVATFRVGGSIREMVWSAEHQTLFVLKHNRLFRFTRDDLIDKFPRIRGDGPESG